MTFLRLALALLLWVPPMFSLDPALSLTDYLHTTWTQEEGIALPSVVALAQTADGYIWLGTEAGLFRFDGMRFVAWEPTPQQAAPEGIRQLCAASGGGLWVGTRATISRIERGRLVRYPDVDRWLAGRNGGMTEDRRGGLWIVRLSSRPELARLERDGSLRIYSARDGLPAQPIWNIFEDSRENLWVITERSLCRWSPGRTAVCPVEKPVQILSVLEDRNQSLVAADGISGRLFRLSEGKLIASTRLDNAYLMPRVTVKDRDGNFWFGTIGQGLIRVVGENVERLTRAEGLSGDRVNALLEDREGNIWAGTTRGLDRFRNARVVRLTTRKGLSSDLITTVSASRDGAIWVGTSGGGLNRVAGGRIASFPSGPGRPRVVSALSEGPDGRLWMGTNERFGYRAGGGFREVRTAKGAALEFVCSIAPDRDGTVWVADGRLGLFSVTDRVARPFAVPGLQTGDNTGLSLDGQGNLWVAHFRGGVTVIRGNSVTNYDSRNGLAAGPVKAIAQDSSGAVWVGTGMGLSRFRNRIWTTWTAQHGVPEGGVNGIIEDDRGALWLVVSRGVARLSLAALSESRDGLPKRLAFPIYGQGDGLRLASSAAMANPRTAKSADGRLWFATDDGVAIVDPGRIRDNPVPPQLAVEQFLVDGRPVDLESAAEPRFRGRQLQISYAGLSFMAPERVRFRYTLDGLDRGWTDAGTRRSVVYVNLPPGHYQFRVTASNNDDVWNPDGAVQRFYIEPYFYQTWWFAMLCVAVPGLVAWGGHRARVRRIVTQFQLIARERARLTRELHDSLLQGFAGVVYQLEAALRQFESAPESSRKRLERAIGQADQSLQEARRTILSMRLPELENSTLPEALSSIGARLTEGNPSLFRLEVKGRLRQLPYEKQAGVYFIAREAITNAVNHARAARITANLTYSAGALQVVIQDDGEGFDPDATAKNGHWGMIGMRERAGQIGAAFTVSSAPGKGTRVELRVQQK